MGIIGSQRHEDITSILPGASTCKTDVKWECKRMLVPAHKLLEEQYEDRLFIVRMATAGLRM
jgi:hypothetical protein